MEMTPIMMRRTVKEKMALMPVARQRIMDRMPSLLKVSELLPHGAPMSKQLATKNNRLYLRSQALARPHLEELFEEDDVASCSGPLDPSQRGVAIESFLPLSVNAWRKGDKISGTVC
jgi:hypothetical protein